MTKTSTRVSFGLYDLTLKQDAAMTCTSEQAWSRLEDLLNNSASRRAYATYEDSFWLLDGQYKFLPSDYTTVHPGLISLVMSGSGGVFTTAPVLTITFDSVHTITGGLSLTFATYSGDYCNSLTVAYYDAANALIRSDAYTPTSTEFNTNQAVSNFKKIVITFNSTSRPYRYLRVQGVNFGEIISFTGASIKTASVVEEIDQLSAEVNFNTLDLGLYSADGDFSIINPAGHYEALAERQPLDVYESIDNVEYYVGKFYLEEWDNTSDTNYKFQAVDLLGVLDRETYKGGIWTSGVTAGSLIETVLSAVNAPYELDNLLAGVVVKGWLPICTYREALQQIAFAIGASVTCSRSGVIKIFASKIAATATSESAVTSAMKGIDQKLSLKPLVTEVRVTAHNYLPSGESQVVVSGQYAAGTYEITFSEPMHALTVSGATITESGVNYAILNVATAGTITLTGLKYIDTKSVASVITSGLSAGVRTNVLKVEDATLVSSDIVATVAQRVSDYYQGRLLQAVKLYASTLEPGAVVTVDTLYSQQIIAVIERMESNLAGGFVIRAEMTGVKV